MAPATCAASFCSVTAPLFGEEGEEVVAEGAGAVDEADWTAEAGADVDELNWP